MLCLESVRTICSNVLWECAVARDLCISGWWRSRVFDVANEYDMRETMQIASTQARILMIARSNDWISSPMMLIVVQVDVQESISWPHTKAVMSRTAGQNQRGVVVKTNEGRCLVVKLKTNEGECLVVKFGAKHGLRTVNSRPANIIYFLCSKL